METQSEMIARASKEIIEAGNSDPNLTLTYVSNSDKFESVGICFKHRTLVVSPFDSDRCSITFSSSRIIYNPHPTRPARHPGFIGKTGRLLEVRLSNEFPSTDKIIKALTTPFIAYYAGGQLTTLLSGDSWSKTHEIFYYYRYTSDGHGICMFADSEIDILQVNALLSDTSTDMISKDFLNDN